MLVSYEFGPYRVDPNGRRLFRRDERVSISGKLFDTLFAIVQGMGGVVEMERLFNTIWPSDKTDHSETLRQHVKVLRRTLGPDGTGENYIVNVTGKGYFICVPVREVAERRVDSVKRPAPVLKIGFGSVIAILIVTVILCDILRPHQSPLPPTPQWGRLLVKATSERKALRRIALGQSADIIAVTPDGLKVYAGDVSSRTLSIVHAVDGTVGTLTLPWEVRSLAISRSGRKLYVGSRVSGITVVDTATDRITSDVIETDGPVFDLALTPDGKRLFMAMSRQGVMRYHTGTRKMRQITDRICAEFVELDSRGKNLFVSYQCNGPKGDKGHDSMEVFNVESEKSVAIVSGLPMVGRKPFVSPDGRLVVLDGSNACWSPEYDKKGCPSVAYGVLHFLWADTRQVVKTLGISAWSHPAGFLDRNHLLLLGDSISVMDAAAYSVVEKWVRKPEEDYYGWGVLPYHGRAFISAHNGKELLVLDAESPACSPPAEGLASFYTGDGVPEDTVGGAALTMVGDVRFAPGRVGQAFLLDGKSGYLTAGWTGYYRFGGRDSSLSLYVKFANTEGKMAILDRTSLYTPVRASVVKSEDNHFIFEFATAKGGPVQLRSMAQAVNNQWFHLAVTKNDEAVSLYIDGELQDRRSLGLERLASATFEDIPLFLGATNDGHALLHGKLDEILFYDRALTGDEVRRLYQLRESGGCRI